MIATIKRALLLLPIALVGCATQYPASERLYVLEAQSTAIENTSDVRVERLLKAYIKGHPRAISAMNEVGQRLQYGQLSVLDGLIMRSRADAIATPVEMKRLIDYLEYLYALQDRREREALAPVFTPFPTH